MRSEEEMLNLIVRTAQQDERIRAVILNGSRANPNALRDPFQDFDVAYFVTEVEPFKYNDAWLERFGERMIMQMPEDMEDPPPANDGCFIYLMQFADGNRIDLTLVPLEMVGETEEESLSVLLLDKDGRFEGLAPADERDYLPRPPTAKAFDDCCNEFWWLCPYVAKGLWREEILYAKFFLDPLIRNQLMKMVWWYIGQRTSFSLNPGKFGKHFRQHLEPELWEMLLQTYSDADYERTWEALFTSGELFRRLAVAVAREFGFDYPQGDDERVSAFLRHVRQLPRDAQEIY
jgi:aminoglycoside 6-adenylyltransferase